ncbi:alpha/beta hydrolase [Microbacterium sp. UFMG61]|uniref:alpha/beta hydrolase n=1 Tax=Microbacterium sp. UFMG61 TaxID=2745935 RepID=UPI00188E8EBC|nr:alpha/beta hydrolase-fold protein [Microbacterium sp. UFMG61]
MHIEIPYTRLPVDLENITYQFGPDSAPRPGVIPGQTVEFALEDSVVYPGTSRRCWIHVPAGYDAKSPAALMLFNDGWWYLDPEGDVRGGIVLDNLVHRGEMPMTIGVFVDPGTRNGADDPKNRNIEYDAFDDRYVTFLTTEVLPAVRAKYAISEDPALHGICGGSSGGNAAFTAAWERPDEFTRVIAYLSSFAQMPGGNPYPELLAATPPKALRILLQAGHRDDGWNQREMNWLAENLSVAAALARAGYDFRLVLGNGGHSPNHGGVLLPDALRWIWRP